MTTRLWSVVLEANDPGGLARFRADALGWPVKDKDSYSAVSRGDGFLPRLEFVSLPEPKISKNRVHFDVAPFLLDDLNAEVERPIALGARRIDVGQGDVSWWCWPNTEGNESCVLPPR